MDSRHDTPDLQAAPVGASADDTLRTEVLVSAEPEDESVAADEQRPFSETHAAGESEPYDEPPPAFEIEPSPADTLSPAVRRLVRQYDLDITGIHGTGPAGKIRVSDVIGMLGRSDMTPRPAEPRDADERTGILPSDRAVPELRPAPAAAKAAAAPATTVFECDLGRVLSHRKQQRKNNVEVLLTSYYLVACFEALKAVPEIAAASANLGVALHLGDDEPRTTLLENPGDTPLDERLLALDGELRTVGGADLAPANLLIHHYGQSGSLLATPTPLGAGHAASLGIGRVRREVVVKTVDGDESPRIAAVCYVTLTFVPDRVPLYRANKFLAQLVRVLEQWPD